MPLQPHQIQSAGMDATHPLAYALARDSVFRSHLIEGAAIIGRGYRTEDVTNVVDLAGQNIEGQGSLARMTHTASHQSNADASVETTQKLDTPFNPAARPDKSTVSAFDTDAALQQERGSIFLSHKLQVPAKVAS